MHGVTLALSVALNGYRYLTRMVLNYGLNCAEVPLGCHLDQHIRSELWT